MTPLEQINIHIKILFLQQGMCWYWPVKGVEVTSVPAVVDGWGGAGNPEPNSKHKYIEKNESIKVLYTALNLPSLIFTPQSSETNSPSLESVI